MPRSAFYGSLAYRKRQSAITKRNQALGIYEHLRKQETRICLHLECQKVFTVKPHDPKKYCSQSCGVKVNNAKRILSETVKQKIANTLKGQPSPYKGILKVPKVERTCSRVECSKIFLTQRWRKGRFCSVTCAIKVTGARPTSPKASRGKAGVRPDISPIIYFYSRWEANIARLYSYLGIVWEYAPKTFDIGGQMYTPDFYLPDSKTYIEVKNFWGEYSRIRDEKFRKIYVDIPLKVILKEEYLELEKKYANIIPLWEYSGNRKIRS